MMMECYAGGGLEWWLKDRVEEGVGSLGAGGDLADVLNGVLSGF